MNRPLRTARDWQWRALFGLLLAATGCEAIIGIPDVTLDTTTSTGVAGTTSNGGTTTATGGATTSSGGATTGGGGTGGATTSSGGATTGGGGTGGITLTGGGGTGGVTGTGGCSNTPCSGAGCVTETMADATTLIDPGAHTLGLTARDGVLHWGTETPGVVVRTTENKVSTLHFNANPARRLVDDGQTVVWSSVYSTCLSLWGSDPGTVTMSKCAGTGLDASPAIAIDATHAYWPIQGLTTCALIPGCCDANATQKSCLVANVRMENADPPTILVSGKYAFTGVTRVQNEIYFGVKDSMVVGRMQRCPLAAAPCNPVDFDVPADENYAVEIVAMGGFIYWSTQNGYIRRKTIGAPLQTPFQTVMSNVYISQMVSDDGSIYYISKEGKVFYLDMSQAPAKGVELGAGGPDARDLAIDCNYVYWNDGTKIYRRNR